MSEGVGTPTLKLTSVDAMRYDDLRSTINRRAEGLADRMRALRDEGRIAIETTDRGAVVWEHQRGGIYHPPQDRTTDDEHSKLYDECTYFGTRSDFRLTDEYERTSLTDDTARVEFPDVILLVYEGDAIRWNLTGVFPSVYEETGVPVTPEDYLSTLEDGGDWRPGESDLVDVSHRSKRDQIREAVADDPGLTGPGWTVAGTRRSVTGTDATADVVFEREDGDGVLLVVVAPNPTDHDDFDRALGRVLRLRGAYLDSVASAAVDPDDVGMAVATPAVPDEYAWVEDDVGVRFLITSV